MLVAGDKRIDFDFQVGFQLSKPLSYGVNGGNPGGDVLRLLGKELRLPDRQRGFVSIERRQLRRFW